MKKTIWLFAFLFATLSSYSQYTVTKVVGKVQNRLSGEFLKPGSKVSDTDILIWSTPNDLIRVIVAGKGIYVISPSQKVSSKPNQLAEIVKSALKVKSKEGYLSGRSQKGEKVPLAFDTDPGVNRLNAFVHENKYVFSSKDYDMNSGTFFLQIERTNTKPIIRQLKTTGDTLYIYAKDFESFISADEAKPKYTLGYYSKPANTSNPIVQITPYVDQTGEMTAIIKAVITASKEKYKSLVEEEAYSEVYVSMGKPSDITFSTLFENIYAERAKKLK